MKLRQKGGMSNLNPFVFILQYDDELHTRHLCHDSSNFRNLGPKYKLINFIVRGSFRCISSQFRRPKY